MSLRRRSHEAKAHKKSVRTKVGGLQNRDDVAHLVGRGNLFNHGSNCFTCEPTAPIGARKLVGDGSSAIRTHRSLNITDRATAWSANDPIEPAFATVGGGAPLKQFETGAQPFDRRRRFVFMFVDRRIAEDGEHFVGVRGDLWLKDKAVNRESTHRALVFEARDATRLYRVASDCPRGYAARSSGTSQPGNTSTAGWHLRARAKTLARSTPKFTRPFSMAEMVACGMPVSADSWLWLSSWSSRRIRTDSPTETSIRFFAGRYTFIL